ncbi:SMP-30/gluconolactonase/LRE family protein [Piscinibacter terrae]|uniref:SMP-30/gluconolactonase/LRE family protein n=1 Tax=Piscinibacter terrae TaxID=2496871 RepID=A0A3N7HQZ2_9BURK|nr:SMP-30/gluconolactonase/LRE family protein [Albitalea terrae]RQP24113.1 SMP-30/gluconolactonase/LRE family protein [Albitalea terrae]
MREPDPDIQVAVASPGVLGEAPMWHPREQVLYYCDIPAKRLNRFDPKTGDFKHWDFDTEPASLAPRMDGSLVLAMRDGLFGFNPATGERERLAKPPYDAAKERFNDGKADPQGRFWAGTIYEPREPMAALYCWSDGTLERRAEGITNSNGLAWSPDGRTMYWADTKAHEIYAFDFDLASGELSRRRVFASFPVKAADQDLATYGGRPDGAAVDSEGCYWIAMFEGARILKLSPQGEVVREVHLPVQCATMPCFGGPDLRTLYITTSREKRPADELARQPLAGCVLSLRVDVPGLPANMAA